MLNLHCNNKQIDKKHKRKKEKNNKIYTTQFPRFEPGIHGFKVHQDIHCAMEANAMDR